MKEIKAYVRENRLEPVIQALRGAGAKAVTAVQIVPFGSEMEPEFVDISRAAPLAHFRPMMKLELVCRDEDVTGYADLIREQARTGDPGDGVIFISAVQDALHIRSGEHGEGIL